MKKSYLFLTLSLLIFTLSACKNEPKETAQSSTSEDFPITLKNFTKPEGGTEWSVKEQTFTKVPERILANTRPAAEFLLHLGLKDKIVGVGAVFGVADPEVADEFDTLNHLSNGYIGKETTLSVDPDLVFGRGGLFENEDWGNGTVDSLNEMGIQTYVQETSVQNATFESVYRDIEQIAKLFNVEKQAKDFSSKLKEREGQLKERAKATNQKQTFALLFMSDPNEISIYPANGESFFNYMFDLIGLDNTLKEMQGEVSLETLIETDPDILIVPDWSTYQENATKNEMVEAVLNNEKLSSMKAIKNKNVYSVDYNYMFGYGYQSLTGMELLMDEMSKK